MNRDDILKMEAGIEMDELILVHVFGYTKLPYPAMPEYQKPTKDGVYTTNHVNHYSTDIKAAWEVHKKMLSNPDYLIKNTYLTNLYRCIYHRINNPEVELFGIGLLSEIEIIDFARAALLAVMENKT